MSDGVGVLAEALRPRTRAAKIGRTRRGEIRMVGFLKRGFMCGKAFILLAQVATYRRIVRRAITLSNNILEIVGAKSPALLGALAEMFMVVPIVVVLSSDGKFIRICR